MSNTEASKMLGSGERVLALEIRARKLGYAVFEGRETLIDWGAMRETGSPGTFDRRFASLCRVFKPETIVIRRAKSAGNIQHGQASFEVIGKIARSLGIQLHLISHENLNGDLGYPTTANKYERAKFIADLFPELSWRLPKDRKPWEAEPARIILFDTVAIGIAYFNHKKRRNLFAGLQTT
jgi:hypothetical protein